MIELLLAELNKLQRIYTPNSTVRARLREVTFVPVIGPFLAGKSTVMAEAARLDHSFGRVRSFTTRPRREDEAANLYDFLPYTETTLQHILQQVQNRELVQFTLHPTTGQVYGSHLSAWRRPFMMLDIMPAALEATHVLRFKAVHPVALAVEPNDWLTRLGSRSHDAGDQAKRIHEGTTNVEWCLVHDVAWLVNSGRTAEATAKALTAVGKGTSNGDANGPAVAEALLQLLRKL